VPERDYLLQGSDTVTFPLRCGPRHLSRFHISVNGNSRVEDFAGSNPIQDVSDEAGPSESPEEAGARDLRKTK
jgi:hypothetical protein